MMCSAELEAYGAAVADDEQERIGTGGAVCISCGDWRDENLGRLSAYVDEATHLPITCSFPAMGPETSMGSLRETPQASAPSVTLSAA